MPASPFATSLSAARALRRGPSPSLVKECTWTAQRSIKPTKWRYTVGSSGAGRWTWSSTRTMAQSSPALGARSTSAGCSKAAPSRTSGRFRASSMARHSGSTTPALYAWHILWSDPLKQGLHAADRPCTRQRHRPGGHRRGGNAGALEFRRDNVQLVRWLGERSPDKGTSWRIQIEFFARRA